MTAAGHGTALDVRGLRVDVRSGGTVTNIVDDLSFTVSRGALFALVGESGSGKSLTCLALAGQLGGEMGVRGSATLDGRQLLSDDRLGGAVAMIFQNPAQCLNPVRTIGFQLVETVRYAQRLDRVTARARARSLLAEVGLADGAAVMARYPHQLSGGMNQRVMIALALATEPALLIADEPTSALDVTTQARILDLLDRLRRDRRMSVLLVTHDLGVALQRADRIGVLYAGRLVETGVTASVMRVPRHHYTRALVASSAMGASARGRLPALDGAVPDPGDRPAGCAFVARCVCASLECDRGRPVLSGPATHQHACFHPSAVGAP